MNVQGQCSHENRLHGHVQRVRNRADRLEGEPDELA